MQDEVDSVESNVPSQYDEVALVEVHHRLRLETRVAFEFSRHPIPKIRDGCDIPAPEKIGGFRNQTAVNGFEDRESTTGSQHAEELGKGIAFSADVDENGSGGHDVDAPIADVGEILGASLHEPTGVGHSHPGCSFGAPLQQFRGDVAEDNLEGVIKRFDSSESDQPVAASNVEENVPRLKVGAGEDSVAVALQLGELIGLEVPPTLAAGQQPGRPRISSSAHPFRGCAGVGRHGLGRHQ
jgi:hypothetical protein